MMKRLKPILTAALLLAMLVSLTGCVIIPVTKHYDDYEPENISKVEIYNITPADVHTNLDECVKSGELVHTLTEEQLQTFWDDLAEIEFSDVILFVIATVDDFGEYGEWVLKITYTDSSYDLISDGGFGENYGSDGKSRGDRYSCDRDEWEDFINKYLPEDTAE